MSRKKNRRKVEAAGQSSFVYIYIHNWQDMQMRDKRSIAKKKRKKLIRAQLKEDYIYNLKIQTAGSIRVNMKVISIEILVY
jgi:hypothetical protein